MKNYNSQLSIDTESSSVAERGIRSVANRLLLPALAGLAIGSILPTEANAWPQNAKYYKPDVHHVHHHRHHHKKHPHSLAPVPPRTPQIPSANPTPPEMPPSNPQPPEQPPIALPPLDGPDCAIGTYSPPPYTQCIPIS